jgi:molybdopterin-guanine dinucleotide biosynthesis protein A
MDGRNKAFLEVGGRSILNRLLASLQPHFQEILLVTRQPELYASTPVEVVVDIYQARSSMTGIHAGLVKARADFIFVVPCDTPFLQPEVIKILLDALKPELDVVVPLLEGHYEPLCAIYSKRCIPMIEAQLDGGNYRIFDFFHQVNVKTLSTSQIRAADPDLSSFFNVNTPSALLACRSLLEKREQS